MQTFIDYNNNSKIMNVSWKCTDKKYWYDILQQIRTLPNRTYNSKTKKWEVPAVEENINILQKMGFELPKEIFIKNDPKQIKKPEWENIKINPSDFPNLRPYQIEALKFLTWRKGINGKGALFDDQGTGKTVQALSYLKLNLKLRPVLIVVPAAVKIQWYREYRKWCSKDDLLEVLNGQTPFPLPKDTTCNYIINWDIISYWIPELLKIDFKIIIADEVQAICNSSAQRTKAFKKLCKRIPGFIPLSGTPIRSKPKQFFNVLNLLDKELFNNEWSYKMRYCDAKKEYFGWNFDGASNMEELFDLISDLRIRRCKKDIMKDLPDKQYTIVPLTINVNSEYKSIIDNIKKYNDPDKKTCREQFEALKNSAFNIKGDQCIKWISDFLENSNEKLVVWAYHRKVVEFVYEKFNSQAIKIYGGISANKKDYYIQRFRRDKTCRLAVCNILAAGVGIDGLQDNCSNEAFIEFAWTSADHDQAEDRLHRMGQKNSVNVYYLVAPGTIEDDIVALLDRSRVVRNKLMDGIDTNEDDLLAGLTKKFIKRSNNNGC